MKFKKGLSLMLSLALCASIALTGCSGSDAKNDTSKDTSKASIETPATTEKPEEKEEKKEELSEEEKQKLEEEAQKKKEEEEKKQLEAQKKEREELEAARKEELGEFYVPLPPLDYNPELKRVEARGLYVTSSVAGFTINDDDIQLYVKYINGLRGTSEKISSSQLGDVNKLERAIAMCIATELNSLVIDVKNDDGVMSYKSEIPITDTVKANRNVTLREEKYATLMETLKKYDIYPIARIVTFKDKNFANHKSDHAILNKSGGAWKDKRGIKWVNPFDKYVWDYNVAIAKEAALRGFKEIQFDYVRFPAGAKYYNPITEFPGRDGRDKDEAIEGFLKYANEELEPYGVFVAADVFGVITKSWDDKPEDIGQTWRKMARYTDYMCPMVYPSHYGKGWYGYDVPDAHPYGVLSGSMKESIFNNSVLKDPPVIRPWIQGFTAKWVKGHIKYGDKELIDQIIAGKELGLKEYLVWDASNNYSPTSYMNEDRTFESYENDPEHKDAIGTTPKEALEMFLKAKKHNIYSKQYVLTPIENRDDSFDVFKANEEKRTTKIVSYETGETKVEGDKTFVSLNYKYTDGTKDENGKDVVKEVTSRWELMLENHIWKVIPLEEI